MLSCFTQTNVCCSVNLLKHQNVFTKITENKGHFSNKKLLFSFHFYSYLNKSLKTFENSYFLLYTMHGYGTVHFTLIKVNGHLFNEKIIMIR